MATMRSNVIETNMVGDYMMVYPVYAYDSGLILNVTNVSLFDVNIVCFLTSTCVDPIPVQCTAATSGINATIPDILLEDGRDIFAYLINDSTDILDAIAVIRIPVIPRKRTGDAMTEQQAHDGIRPTV